MGRLWAFHAVLAVSLLTAAAAFFFGKPGGDRVGVQTFADNGCVFDTSVCYVPFARLINFPERYQGREIRTIGFMAWAPPASPLPLYPSEEDVDLAKGRYEKIEIFVDERQYPAVISTAEKRHGVWVTVRGVFDVSRSGMPLASLHAQDIEDVTINRGAKPPPPPVRLREPSSTPDTPPQFGVAPDAH